ncbi:MAG TPA: polysaccharide deacetylase family protein [Acidobacteriaceae bacterium]
MSHASEIAKVASVLAAGGAAALAAYVVCGLRPESQLFGRTLVAPRNPTAGPPEIALTFDDGPNPTCTPYLLDLLGKYGVRATFFVIGQFAAQEPALVRRAHEEGHLIANHTLRHPNLFRTDQRTTRDELARTQVVLEQITGERPRFFRPPYGMRRPATLRIARAMGLTPVTWNVIGNDWTPLTAEEIAERVRTLSARNTQRGFATNLVLHDGDHRTLTGDRSRTLKAVELLLPELVKTRRFVRLDAWSA